MAGWGALAARGIKSASRKHQASKALDQFAQVVPVCSLKFRIDFQNGTVEEAIPPDGPFTHHVVSWSAIASRWPAPGLDKETKSAVIRGLRDDSADLCAQLGGREVILLEISRNGTVSPALVGIRGLQILDLRIPAVANLAGVCAPRLLGSPTPPPPPPPPSSVPLAGSVSSTVPGTGAPSANSGGNTYCTSCGTARASGASFCTRCGQPYL